MMHKLLDSAPSAVYKWNDVYGISRTKFKAGFYINYNIINLPLDRCIKDFYQHIKWNSHLVLSVGIFCPLRKIKPHEILSR